MNLIAYTYEADYHCIDCAVKRYGKHRSICIHYVQGKPCTNCRDSNGILYEQKDSEGNLVHPLFSTDEWQDMNSCDHDWDWQCVCSDTQYLTCGDCHEVIEEYTEESRG